MQTSWSTQWYNKLFQSMKLISDDHCRSKTPKSAETGNRRKTKQRTPSAKWRAYSVRDHIASDATAAEETDGARSKMAP